MNAPVDLRRWDQLPSWMLVVGAMVLAAAVYLPTLTFAFVYDDGWTILDNGLLRHPGDLWLLLSPEAATRNVVDAHRPTLVVFDTVTYQLLGLRPVAHHAVSVALHLWVMWALHRWLGRLGAPPSTRAIAVAVFGVMAIHAEAVTVVSFREDLLAAALALEALDLQSRALDRSGPRLWWAFGGAAALLAAAAGAKMSAAGAPLLWGLAHGLRPFGGRRIPTARIVGGIVIGLVGVGAAVAQTAVVAGSVTPFASDTDPRLFHNHVGTASVLAASVQIHAGYLQQMLIPIGLRPEYVDYGASWSDPGTTLTAAGFALATGYAIWGGVTRRRPLVAFAIVGGILLAIPTANLLPMPNMRAERFMYLPSLAFAIGVGHALAVAWESLRTRAPGWGVAAIGIVLVTQGALGQAASRAYKSDTRLWEIGLRKAPHSARAHAITGELKLAELRRRTGPTDDPTLAADVSAHCARALALDPADALAHMCEGRWLAHQKHWTEAAAAFERARARATVRVDRPLLALASVRLDLPEIPEPARAAQAETLATEAIERFPYVAQAFAIAGRLQHRLGNADAAAAHYARARSLRPERWDLVLWGLELQLDLGHASAAREAWVQHRRTIKRADPTARSSVSRRLWDARRLFPSDDLSSGAPPP